MAPPKRRRRARPARRGVFGSLIDEGSEILQSVANEVAPGVVGALDVDGVVQRIDFQAVIDKVDLNAVLEEVDLDALLARADLNAVLDRVDINLLVDQLDVGKIIDKVDVNTILERVDIDALIAHTHIGAIVGRSGASVLGKAADSVRGHGASLDDFVHRWVDRLLGRGTLRRPSGPARLVPRQEPAPS